MRSAACYFVAFSVLAGWVMPVLAQQPAANTAQPVQQALPPALPSKTPPTAAAPTIPPIPAATGPVLVAPVPVVPPGPTNPPPVAPALADTPKPAAPAAAPKEATFDTVRKLVENPAELQKLLEQAPQKVPQELNKLQQRVADRNLDESRFNGDNFDKLPWKNSLMFRPEDLARLYEAARGNLRDTVTAGVVVEVKTPRVAPAFYLNSMLYNSPDNWTIWLNSRRVRTGTKFPELEIASVNADRVEFIWMTDQLDFISPKWDEKIKQISLKENEPQPRWLYVSDDGNISVDQSRRYVRFLLGPHQTFMTHDMEIAEGYRKSTFFESVQQLAPNVAIGQPGAAPAGGIAVSGAAPLPAATGTTQPATGGIPGAAPGSPMGGPRTTPLPPTTPLKPATLNPVALPPAMTQKP